MIKKLLFLSLLIGLGGVLDTPVRAQGQQQRGPTVSGPFVWIYTGSWEVEQEVYDAALDAAGVSVHDNPARDALSVGAELDPTPIFPIVDGIINGTIDGQSPLEIGGDLVIGVLPGNIPGGGKYLDDLGEKFIPDLPKGLTDNLVPDMNHNTGFTPRVLPPPGKGRGTVSPNDRDPRRVFTPNQKKNAWEERGQCCENCGKTLGLEDLVGHHIIRHADGGLTIPENLALLCIPCHLLIHGHNK
ncbi:MAG: HNH endonuclease signature motif containing protein [Planctomycetota bacterium]